MKNSRAADFEPLPHHNGPRKRPLKAETRVQIPGTIRVGSRSLKVRQKGARKATDEDPPTMPAGLQARRLNASSVELTWTDGQGETSYKIKRRGTAFRVDSESVHTLAANTTRFVDRGLERGFRHCYTLRALCAAGTSAAAKVCIKTPR